jgi:hypothetical protein
VNLLTTEGHRGFFTEGRKLGGEFLTAEDAEVTELDGEKWFSANDKILFFFASFAWEFLTTRCTEVFLQREQSGVVSF